MTGYVYFVFISSEFFYILESPSNGLCGIFRVGRILGTRAESVVYGYHGVALLQELLRKMFFSGFQSSAVEPDKGGKSFFISRIMEVELATLQLITVFFRRDEDRKCSFAYGSCCPLSDFGYNIIMYSK